MRYTIPKLSLVVLLLSGYSHAAPEILSYSGKMSVSGQPYNGTAELKIALVNRSGTFSYWTNDGNFTTPQEPAQAVSVNVANGIYTVRLGDTSISNMQVLPGSVFKDHNDAHLRIWIRLGSTGNFEMLSPDQAISSAPYSLGGNGSLNASPLLLRVVVYPTDPAPRGIPFPIPNPSDPQLWVLMPA